VADWTDKWATVSLDARNFASPNGSFLDNASTQGANFGTISYRFDDEVARGLFDEDIGLHIPLAPAGQL
jgi:hypothetical protein